MLLQASKYCFKSQYTISSQKAVSSVNILLESQITVLIYNVRSDCPHDWIRFIHYFSLILFANPVLAVLNLSTGPTLNASKFSFGPGNFLKHT